MGSVMANSPSIRSRIPSRRSPHKSTDRAVTLPCALGTDSGRCIARWHGHCFHRRLVAPRPHCIGRCAVLQETTMSRQRILVINPNSNHVVTQGLEEALKPLGFEGGPEIVCETLAEGPYGIESQADVDGVAMPLRRLVEGDNSSAAFVIACYSDPGLHVCREATDRPVFGIAECGVLKARARPQSVGGLSVGAAH